MEKKNQSLKIKNQSAKIVVAFLYFLLFAFCSYSQLPFTTAPEKTETRNGNKQFDKGNYTDAEANYKKAFDKKNNMPEATFNLGDAVYEQKDMTKRQNNFSFQGKPTPIKILKRRRIIILAIPI